MIAPDFRFPVPAGYRARILEEGGQRWVSFVPASTPEIKPQASLMEKPAKARKRAQKKRRKRTRREWQIDRTKINLLIQIQNLCKNTDTGWTTCSRKYMLPFLRGPKGHEYRKTPCTKTLSNYMGELVERGLIHWNPGTADLNAQTSERGDRFISAFLRLEGKGRGGKPQQLFPENVEAPATISSSFSEFEPGFSFSTNSTSLTSSTSAEPEAKISIDDLWLALRARISTGSLELIQEHYSHAEFGKLVISSALPGHLQALLRRTAGENVEFRHIPITSPERSAAC